MGIIASRRTPSNKDKENEDVPRFAYPYHSVWGYLGFFYQFFMGLMSLCIIFGFFQTSSTLVLLIFIILGFVLYLGLFWTNSRWYGVTFTTRRYLKINMNECLGICYDVPNYDRIIARDLKFHNDQWHFSVGAKAYFYILIFFAIFLGLNGTANPSPDYNVPPVAYTAFDNTNHIIIKLVALMVAGLAGILSVILLDTIACFLHSTLSSLNAELVAGSYTQGGVGLQTPSESPSQLVQPGEVILPVVIGTKHTRNYLGGNK